TWGLSATVDEWAALVEMLSTCLGEVTVSEGDGIQTTPASSLAPTPTSILHSIPIPTLFSTTTPSPTPDCVNINTSSSKELQRITHVGEARALEIMSLRPLRSVQDLDRVSGIGPSRLADILAQGLACVS
ncbi:MAG: helix-hairpin-helix domain-containing protein, partial [Dehalococcoidia bacterium]|nr:helix-hairpin-helix domain-containing protein [Dehalococcoidia bacterium]